MDVYSIEAWLGLPEFRVVDQVIAQSGWSCISNDGRPRSCVPDARRAAPASGRAGRGACATCPSSSARSYCGCICDALSAKSAAIDPGKRARPSVHECNGPNASITRSEPSSLVGVRAASWPGAMASLHAPCFAGPLSGVGAAVRDSWAYG
jgi:hypothetical protein